MTPFVYPKCGQVIGFSSSSAGHDGEEIECQNDGVIEVDAGDAENPPILVCAVCADHFYRENLLTKRGALEFRNLQWKFENQHRLPLIALTVEHTFQVYLATFETLQLTQPQLTSIRQLIEWRLIKQFQTNARSMEERWEKIRATSLPLAHDVWDWFPLGGKLH